MALPNRKRFANHGQQAVVTLTVRRNPRTEPFRSIAIDCVAFLSDSQANEAIW